MDDIAIIGGGASCVLLLTNLSQQLENIAPLSIRIFDKTGIFGKGIAYSTQNKVHLLNVRASGMSGLHTEPDHLKILPPL